MRDILLFLFFLLSQQAFSQNQFYNTQHFGLESTMLGGAITAGNTDLSMAYYNPAALHLAKPFADISLVQPRYDKFGFGNFFGAEAKSERLNIALSPSLASFKVKISDKINLIVITIQKSQWNHSVKSQYEYDADGFRHEQIFKYNYQGKDRWIGTGINFKKGKHFALGVSQFFSTARYNYGYTLLKSSYDSETQTQSQYFSDELRSASSNDLSLVTKLGLHIFYPRHSVGLVLKTPNYLALLKGGNYERKTVEVSPSFSSIETMIDFSLNPRIKTPWEFSLGYAFLFKKSAKLWLNAAYYPEIKEYTSETIKGLSGALALQNGSRAVSNFSLGFTGKISPKFEVITSLRTNFFAYENKVPEAHTERLFILDNDQYHLSLGANCKHKSHSILLGLDYGLSRSNNETLFAGFPNLDKLTTTNSDFKNSSLTLLVTYGFLLDRWK